MLQVHLKRSSSVFSRSVLHLTSANTKCFVLIAVHVDDPVVLLLKQQQQQQQQQANYNMLSDIFGNGVGLTAT
jgi:hypothetical protein